jgi:DNA segregation ATPase FtsK/SpoIIIE, S-DNA-T family
MLKTLLLCCRGLIIIFVAMANKLKGNSTKNPVEKTGKIQPDNLKTEKEEKINLKEIARDERTWKIIGFIFLFFAFFLFIAFISYFFTWENDQSEIRKGLSLFNDKANVHNLLGVLGAFISHFFIYKGFGVASLLICTFFFVVGINLLLGRKVWSVWKNLRYVTIGMLVLSVSLAFIFSNSQFSFGGSVGKMIVDWLDNMLGAVGTAALLFVVAVSYIIWQFNPAFNRLQQKKGSQPVADEMEKTEEPIQADALKTINDVYAESNNNGNSLKNNGEPVILSTVNTANTSANEFTLVEKDEPVIIKHVPAAESIVEKELPILPEEEIILPKQEIKPAKKSIKEDNGAADLALEIKAVPEKPGEIIVIPHLICWKHMAAKK